MSAILVIGGEVFECSPRFFGKNPRLSMLVSTFDKMNYEKQKAYLITAEKFLERI